MNKKAQIEGLIGVIVEFVVIFILVGAIGSVIYPLTYDIPFGVLFRFLLPGSDSVLINFMKQLIWATVGTGGTFWLLSTNR